LSPAARRSALVLIVIAASAEMTASAGCSRRAGGSAAEASLPPIKVTDDTPGLVLTWIDDKGEAHVTLRPADVPAAGRAMVRVVITDREEGTRDRFYVADLTQKADDGAYPTRTMPRRDWELELERRREANLAKGGPPPTGARGDPQPPPAQEQDAQTVIIYGASWCKPCHHAADYLRRKGVAYVLKDIDETPGAAAEMREKLGRIGRPGERSIPIIDVRGQILVGFDRGAVDRALAKTGVRGRR
jgi:glutaredoxin